MASSTTLMLNVMTPSHLSREGIADNVPMDAPEMLGVMHQQPSKSLQASLSMADILTNCLNPGKKRDYTPK